MEEALRSLEADNYRVSVSEISDSQIFAAVKESEESYDVRIISEWRDLVLHWGIAFRSAREWVCPLKTPEIALENAVKIDEKAAQSTFVPDGAVYAIRFSIPKHLSPKQINFVLKRGENWYNNNNRDYALPLIEGAMSSSEPEFVRGIIDAEAGGSTWSLMHRFNMCIGLLKSSGTEGLPYIYVWMRYSALRYLTWQRSYHTRPGDLTHSQQVLTFTLTDLTKSYTKDGFHLIFLRNILGGLGKGGNHGAKIREEILKIMHNNGVSDRGNHFYEQWHQKLHNNTTVDDIGICEAVIAFNETNNIGKYWEVLHNHGISRERLLSFDRPISNEPYYAPQLINDLRWYLDILRSVHEKMDLHVSVRHTRHAMNGDLGFGIDEVMKNLHHWDKVMQLRRIVSARQMIHRDSMHHSRDFLYLDIALEGYAKNLIEGIIHIDVGVENLFDEFFLLLDCLVLVMDNELLSASKNDLEEFYRRYRESFRSQQEHALILKSATDRFYAVLGAITEKFIGLIDPIAQMMGSAFGVDPYFYELFAEECLRETVISVLSQVLKKINNELRIHAGSRPWQIISPKENTAGRLLQVQSLSENSKYTEPTILIVQKVSGEEEIPEGVVGVISKTDLDSLAHISVRARNFKTLLVVCYEEEALSNANSYIGQIVKLEFNNQGLSISETNQVPVLDTHKAIILEKPEEFSELILDVSAFSEGKVGAKSRNCALLESLDSLSLPASMAIPFGVFEYVMDLPMNQSVKEKFVSSESFQEKAKLIKTLKIGEEDQRALIDGLNKIGVNDSNWDMSWSAIVHVWASKYSERVKVFISKAGIDIDDIYMSVLCQPIIEADYAFVLHTKNPFNNKMDELYGEIVLGLGETLVGAYEGKALSFIIQKEQDSFEVLNFCNKSVMLKNSGIIFRSDSNCEDLDEFSGAGLFESYPICKNKEIVPRYSQEPLVVDVGFRANIIKKLGEIGKEIEHNYGGIPQDIEGVILNQKIFVVQSRPQI